MGVIFDWTTDVGTIDANGLFTAQLSPGVGNVTATNGSVSGSANVTVFDAPPVADAGPDQSIQTHTLVVFDGSGSYDDVGITLYQWDFTDFIGPQTLFGVSPSYTFDFPGSYNVTLTVMDGMGQTDSDYMFVNATDIDHIVVSPNPVIILVNEVLQFTATAYDQFNNVITGVDFVWTTDVGSINATGFFTAQSTPGTGTVTATYGTVSGIANVEVVTVPTIDNIVVLPDPVSVLVGETQQFSATAYDQFNTVIIGVEFTWTTDVGVIDVNGLFTAQFTVATGFVNATNGTVTGSAAVTVKLYSHQVNLEVGWNLLSFPLIVADTSVLSVLSSIAGSWDIVQAFDASDKADHWKMYATFKPPPLNDLQNIDNTMGFWLHMLSPATLNISGLPPTSMFIQMYAGWNLIGYPSLDNTRTIVDVLFETGYDKPVEGYDENAPYLLSPLPDTYIMTPGEGYWVHVPSDVIWEVINSVPDNGAMRKGGDLPLVHTDVDNYDSSINPPSPVWITQSRGVDQAGHQIAEVSDGVSFMLVIIGLLAMMFCFRPRKRRNKS
jgi:hypothetical protein